MPGLQFLPIWPHLPTPESPHGHLPAPGPQACVLLSPLPTALRVHDSTHISGAAVLGEEL